MIRILVTGSRTWVDRNWIADELIRAFYEVLAAKDIKTWNRIDVTLVSGACPRGADRIAEELAEERGWTVERHPARWDEHGRRAGFLRNLEMVQAGADICLAFVRDGSRGATHCGQAAERAGIPTRWNEAL
jgi:SLOG family YspA-like protein